MLTEAFLAGKEVIDKLNSHNHQAFFVGGCVRDLLLNREIGDIDIATSAAPKMVQNIFDKVIPVGIEHGTVIVRHKQQSFEVTTFRVDGKYTDQRHPDEVTFVSAVDKDLERRDFTINALAMDMNGKIIDLFGGKKDLQQKVIRTVGDGYERFTEDPLRIIRAIRFSGQLGFFIDHDTLQAMEQVKKQIKNLAKERITQEITKLFAGSYLNLGIDYLKRTEIYKNLPIIAQYPGIIHKLPKSLKPLYSFGETIALFHYIEPQVPIINWVKAWKCSNKIKQEAIQLIDALRYYQEHQIDKWLVYQLDSVYYSGFDRLISIFHPEDYPIEPTMKKLVRELPIQSKKDLALNGNHLMELFPEAPKGPWLKNTINRLEKEVVLGRIINTKYTLKEWIRCNPPEIN
ncbi:CCA tRNA nucleotidyltransferase [Virgibacillus alimentarius]|uniref:CCA tRNA nucleotidyltransferase n=1 Tax=Virgibacillus alimentarius TaxID=698769 RepID=UPI0004939E96|nr:MULTISPECIES: CCA tRNA nucleotidyltransferase [Virgibacillus]HLR66305.1 CCA tRNA nucleotidyltransferase [Virgibacillus sp.]